MSLSLTKKKNLNKTFKWSGRDATECKQGHLTFHEEKNGKKSYPPATQQAALKSFYNAFFIKSYLLTPDVFY